MLFMNVSRARLHSVEWDDSRVGKCLGTNGGGLTEVLSENSS